MRKHSDSAKTLERSADTYLHPPPTQKQMDPCNKVFHRAQNIYIIIVAIMSHTVHSQTFARQLMQLCTYCGQLEVNLWFW